MRQAGLSKSLHWAGIISAVECHLIGKGWLRGFEGAGNGCICSDSVEGSRRGIDSFERTVKSFADRMSLRRVANMLRPPIRRGFFPSVSIFGLTGLAGAIQRWQGKVAR
jgi:hypothetical protein